MEASFNATSQLKLRFPVICIVGPTASGKTDVSQLVALNLNAEIISADSMQIYEGMDIGTGKLPMKNRLVPHYGLDLVPPGAPYSAALFQHYARSCFLEIDRNGSRSILCGGTGFYIRAAIDDYEFPEGQQVDNPTRERYLKLAAKYGNQAVWDELRKLDPESAACIHPHNVKRVIRALELNANGESYAQQKSNLAHIRQYVPACFFGLKIDPSVLNERIDERVDKMLESGLVGEVKSLLAKGFEEGITAPQAIGYKEIVQALNGEITMNEAIDRIKISTHRYAKRQRSWFNHDKRITWIEATNRSAQAIARDILSMIEQS